MENGLVFDVRTDTNDNGGGKVREYRCPARHRIVPYTSLLNAHYRVKNALSRLDRAGEYFAGGFGKWKFSSYS